MLSTRLETLASGRRLRVARLGDGPPLVLLHGYPENLQIWCALAPRLAGKCEPTLPKSALHHEVIAFDWPGMGNSDAWPGGATPEHMAQRLRELLDHFQLGRVSLVGQDMGGQPALVFAARYPERIDKLVIMNSLVFGDEPTSWEIRLLRRFALNRFILRNFPRAVFRRAERTFLPRDQRLPSALRADFWETFRQRDVRAFISKMCAGYQGSLARLPEVYSLVRCPTLVLWGEHDRHFPPVHAKRLRAAIAGSQLEVVSHGEHWMVWSLADAVADRIVAFFARSSASIDGSGVVG